jgi:hypothetical protein
MALIVVPSSVIINRLSRGDNERWFFGFEAIFDVFSSY